MTIPGAQTLLFHTSAELQDFLLTLPADELTIVPHLRLAHQVWRRQRQAARDQGLAAWEPAALTTLSGWWRRLWDRLWEARRPASTLQRLVLWLDAMAAVSPPDGVTPDLPWAARLDEAYDLQQRYRLPAPDPLEAASILISWRQALFSRFTSLLADRQLVSPAALPELLLAALPQLSLPPRLVVVGLETPAPVELAWLQAVAQRLPVTQALLLGRADEAITLQGEAFPDRRRELEWVAAQVLELAHDRGVPLHRLAVTAPNLETYLPDLHRIFRELLGPAATPAGGLYNFSLGPTLADTPLFHAALSPLQFLLAGEPRRDLIAWLLSPFYGFWPRRQRTILRWDLAWRRAGTASGLAQLEKTLSSRALSGPDQSLWSLIRQALALLPAAPATSALWRRQLEQLWELTGFPARLEAHETGQWQDLLNLFQELPAAAGDRLWTGADLVAWLTWAADRLDQPGAGSSEAGIQIQGLLELRGLDFDAVFCLGLNLGVFPPPPRHLPLLTSREKSLVLGGDYQSQQEFAETSYKYLLAAAPALLLTRPQVEQDEDQSPSPIIPPIWPPDPVRFAALSVPHPAWQRSPAVRAAFLPPAPGPGPAPADNLPLPLPEVMSLSALETALSCPCRFYLNVLLGLEELPDIQAGLPPQERGSVIHAVLHAFICRFRLRLDQTGFWDDDLARRDLAEVVAEHEFRGQDDPHWEAELARWLAGEEGLLQQWLQQEKARFQEGWRWLAMEDDFQGLQLPGWPTRIKGRLDRLDRHPSQGLMLWDYKTGAVPDKKVIRLDRGQFQLPGYLLAVQQGLTSVPPQTAVRAGIIGLKSTRAEHLKFEDFGFTAADWREILPAKLPGVADVGRRVGEGDFRPDPSQPPPAKDNSCRYCPFLLLCGRRPADQEEEGEEAAP